MDTPATKKTANGRSGEFHHEEDTWDQRKVMKNLLVISTAFFFMFTAFMVSFKERSFWVSFITILLFTIFWQ